MPGSPVIRGSKDGQPQEFDTFSPKVLAGIATGRLPDTIRDRSIIIAIDRKLKTERVERLRHRRLEKEVKLLRERLQKWAEQNAEALSEFELAAPIDKISDRLEDAWEPLLAIADLAGEDYPERAIKSAIELAAEEAEDAGPSHAVLRALHKVFAFWDAMFSRDVVAALNSQETFAEWNDGAGIKPTQLASLLKPYRVKPRTVRIAEKTAKGYLREQLERAWQRYTPDLAVTPVTTQQPRAIRDFSEPSHDAECDGTRNGRNPDGIRDVTL